MALGDLLLDVVEEPEEFPPAPPLLDFAQGRNSKSVLPLGGIPLGNDSGELPFVEGCMGDFPLDKEWCRLLGLEPVRDLSISLLSIDLNGFQMEDFLGSVLVVSEG